MAKRFVALAAVAAAIAIVPEGCADENALVGGTCAPLEIACDGRCVDVAADPANCGSCGAACAPGVACASGVCGGPSDGASGDGSGDGASGDGNADASGDGAATDGADACPPPPYVTPANCGACGRACATPTSACRLDTTGVYTCQPPCVPPLVQCNGLCIDVKGNDPLDCGACNKQCPSNVCLAGVCQGATPGDVLIVGHDYRFALAGTSQARILTNSVFIPPTNPLRVLSYEQYAEAAAVSQAKSIIAAAAGGRTVDYTVSTVGTSLQANDLAANFDVVLIYDQAGANAATLTPLGASSAASLNLFAKAGGVIVVLDGAAGSGAMPSFTTSSGLLDLASHTSIAAGSQVQIVVPADKIASLVASPYGTFDRSVTFQSNEPNGGNVIYVAEQRVGGVPRDPVVIHKVVP